MIIQIPNLKISGVLKGDPVGIITEAISLAEVSDKHTKDYLENIIGLLHLKEGDYLILKNPLQYYFTISQQEIPISDKEAAMLINNGMKHMIMYKEDKSGKKKPYRIITMQRLEVDYPSLDQDEIEIRFMEEVKKTKKLVPDKTDAEIATMAKNNVGWRDNYYLLILKSNIIFRTVRKEIENQYRNFLNILKGNVEKKESLIEVPSAEDVQKITKIPPA